MRYVISAITALLLAIPAMGAASVWKIDADHSNVGFKVRHMMVTNVQGHFAKYDGTVDIDDKDITKSKIQVVIDTASIDTNVVKRDEHLRSADFFDVTRYPTMTFVSKKIVKDGKERLRAHGDLTLHGVTREVVLDIEGPTAAYKDPWGNIKRGATASTKINRKDFGLLWNAAIKGGGVIVGDDVNIILEIQLVKTQ